MNKYLSVFLLLFLVCPVSGAGVEDIEKQLQKSSPGLPQFRVMADPMGNVRVIRTLPGAKSSGVFSVSRLKPYVNVSFLDLSGLKELDLTGLAEFKSLRTLKIGAEKLSGLSGISSDSIVRLDLSDSVIKDISWLKKFPALRVLYLPESVNDISALSKRSFRSISAPGIENPAAVCQKLGITLQIRPEGFQPRSFRHRANSVPPVKLYRDPKGVLTGVEFWRLKRPRRLNSGFTGEMFPEETENTVLQQIPQDSYPALQKFKRDMPFELSAFSADSKSIQKLDLRSLHAVIINGEAFPELRELKISGAVKGLETLKAPKLTRLYLENVESFDPSASLLRRRRGALSAQDRSRRKNLPLITLPAGLKLHTLKIVPARDEFDFNSLKKVSFRNLEAEFYGSDLTFLAGKNAVSLKLRAPAVTGNAAGLLAEMTSLKELNLSVGKDVNYSFLRRLKLNSLALSAPSAGNFTPDMLRKMPLRTLALHLPSPAGKIDWNKLQQPKLTKLILSGITFKNAAFLGRFPQLQDLALENCIYSPAVAGRNDLDLEYRCASHIADRIVMLKKLKNLRLGKIGIFGWNRLVNMDFPWEKLSVLRLENMSVCSDIADWGRKFKHLQRLKIDDISKHGIAPEQLRFDHQLKVLSLTNIRPRPDRPVPDSRAIFRRPFIPAPRNMPGIAQKVYIDVPGGFNGGFIGIPGKNTI